MGINVYMPQDIKEHYTQFNAVAVTEKSVGKIGIFEFIPFRVPHDGVVNFGYLIFADGLRILWMTDYNYCPYTFQKYRPDTLLIEANYSKEYVSEEATKRDHVLRGHCEINTTLGIIRANMTDSLKTVILCHLSHESADSEEFIAKARACVPEGVTVDFATAGKSWVLNTDDKCPFL